MQSHASPFKVPSSQRFFIFMPPDFPALAPACPLFGVLGFPPLSTSTCVLTTTGAVAAFGVLGFPPLSTSTCVLTTTGAVAAFGGPPANLLPVPARTFAPAAWPDSLSPEPATGCLGVLWASVMTPSDGDR